MNFINLTKHLPVGDEKVNIDKLSAKCLKESTPSYKLENQKGLIWCSLEREDKYYCDWEAVQPLTKPNFAVQYKEKDSTYIAKPEELITIREDIQEALAFNKDVRSIVLKFIQNKYPNKRIEHVMCEIDNEMDIADLHTLVDSFDKESVVNGYGKMFSAMFWNYIDEKDESCFEVPTLMIMDSSCMEITKIAEVISYENRIHGEDKYSKTVYEEKPILVEAVKRIDGIEDTKRTPIKEWFLNKIKSLGKERESGF